MTDDEGSRPEPAPARSSALAPRDVPESERVAADLVAVIEGLVDDAVAAPASPDQVKRLEWLIETLIARGHLARSHARLLNRIKGDASVVRLSMYPDKRAVPSSGIDCASLLHLCKGRCCAMDVSLSAEDLAERRLSWDLQRPYLLAKNPDHGYCANLDGGGRCTVYDDRPGTCRAYDCTNDPRVWLDFAAKVPAPMPWFLTPPEEWPGRDQDAGDDDDDSGRGAGPTTSAG